MLKWVYLKIYRCIVLMQYLTWLDKYLVSEMLDCDTIIIISSLYVYIPARSAWSDMVLVDTIAWFILC